MAHAEQLLSAPDAANREAAGSQVVHERAGTREGVARVGGGRHPDGVGLYRTLLAASKFFN
jgi:hypothetical protein